MTSAPASDEPVGADDFAPWDGRRVPVTLLGGYLGAGKTTTINELLARTDRPIAVLVNDVGEINIDARLVAQRHGDTIELTDGCICCSLSQGLAAAFDDLRRRTTAPDHLLIELSGVAEPARVVPWANSPGFRLEGVVVLVDGEQFLDQLDRPPIQPLLTAQVAAADVVLITKLDLVDPGAADAVAAEVARIAPDTPVLRPPTAMAAASLLDTGTRRDRGVTDLPPPALFDHHHAATVAVPDPVTEDELASILDGLGPDVMRAKGVVRAADGGLRLVQVVGRRRLVTPLPQAEDQGPTDLVVIRIDH